MEILEDRETTILKIGLAQLIIAGLLIFALANRQQYLAVLLLTLLVFIYGARLWSRWSPFRLCVQASVDRCRIFPGEKVILTTRAENRKALPIWLRLAIPIPEELEDGMPHASVNRDQAMLWFQSAHFSIPLTPRRRGVYKLGPPRVIVGDMLGLYPRPLDQTHDRLELIVYPRLRLLRPFVQVKRDLFGNPGAKSPVQDPIYLLGTRDYQAGRPAKYIHWIASARLNRLQEREFEPSRQARVLFLLDVSSFIGAGNGEQLETSIEVLASLAVECDRQGFALGLATDGMVAGNRYPVVPIGRGDRQVTLILETLAGVRLATRQPLAESLRTFAGLHSGLSCVLFTLSPAASSSETIKLLHQKKSAVTIVCASKQAIARNEDYPRMLPLIGLLAREAEKA